MREKEISPNFSIRSTTWNVKSSSPDGNATEDTWQISRTQFKAGECSSLNNDGSRRLISLKRRLRLVPESARVVNVFPTPFFLCRWSRGSSWKFMTLWNRVPELLGWRMDWERRGRGERNNFENAQTQGTL